jgi:hypothetical protein
MAWTFRRRVKVAGMNLNLSPSGLGVSAGAGPFRFGVDAKGRHYTSVRGPFGLYNRQYHTPSATAAPEPQPQQFVTAAAKTSAYLLVVAALFIVFAVQDSQPLWLLGALLTAMPACLTLIGYFSDAGLDKSWYRGAAVLAKVEGWVIVGLIAAASFFLFELLAGALAGGKRRRR